VLKTEETHGVARSQDYPDTYSILANISANTKHRNPLNLPEHMRCYTSVSINNINVSILDTGGKNPYFGRASAHSKNQNLLSIHANFK
jgi:hypothetical protein